MSHVYGKGYYTSSSSTTSTKNQEQPSSFSFDSSGDDFEYDSSVLSSPGNKRPHLDLGPGGKRLRLSDNLHCSNNPLDDERGTNGNEHGSYSMNGNNYYSNNRRKNESYHPQQTAPGIRNDFSHRQTNGYNSSNGLYHRRNEDVSNFSHDHDQRQNHNLQPFIDDHYNDNPQRPFHRQPEPRGMGHPQFDVRQPRNVSGNNQGQQNHQGPRWSNGFNKPFRQQPQSPFNANRFPSSDSQSHQKDFNPRFPTRDQFPSGPTLFANRPRPDHSSTSSGSSSVSPPKELMAPVFQTRDRVESDWGAVMAATASRSQNKVDAVTERSERSEAWAWSSGKKWDAPGAAKPKLNVYTAPPKAEMFREAAQVSGGIGEKLLQKMGWNKGQGLGKTGHGSVNPIQFNEIKTDRRGLKSEEDAPKDAAGVKSPPEEPEEESWEKVKSKFAVMKSSSFWGWHNSGMRGPDTIKGRIKVAKKEAKAKEPVKEVSLVGKHPVSGLLELSHKRGWPEPRFSEERGPRGFRFRVEVNGQTYQPPEFSDNKKNAKKDAAQHCLVTMGLVPPASSSS